MIPARTGTRLPPELCDETIDHLWDDIDSLRACSLTCKDWLPSSRFHLFRSVRLRHADDLTRFRALLASAPSVALCVRKLSLNADHAGIAPDGSPRVDDGWVDATAALFPLLTHLTALALARIRWHALAPATRAALTAAADSIRQLFLFDVSFAASRDVILFLSAFPALRELYFQSVSWAHDSPSPFEDADAPADAQEPAGRMQLSYLFLDPASSPTLVTEWLLRRPDEPRLQTIQLCWRELANTKPVGDLLRASGASLETLHVEFPTGDTPDPAPAPPNGPGPDPVLTFADEDLSLAHNTALRALHFGGLDARASRAPAGRRLFPWVAAMLGALRAPRLEEVSLALEVGAPADLAALDWPRIDAGLCRDELRGLARELKRELAERLAGFRARGTLSVSCI
ncbi:uncharacterized protein BXZ73DRAFT_90570 [Epithele typhae]|uniref:uncharacterized protein n=1 Tax=Epithele typhae TaxID=378194 RepID=UPI002008DC68|nr:uncharacterized protein BXZ73DRAFT_90570 [Epithele typhae]KAH9928499.1 hypothetical protein BXZ73DRAFT_90570 [Epithele typhae]